MTPIQLQVIAPVLEGYGLCNTCELLFSEAKLDSGPVERGLDEYPPDWIKDYQRLSEWLVDLSARYGHCILVKVIDPQSLEGFFKCLRYRVRRYPAFIVEGQKQMVGWDKKELEAILESHVAAS
ncbi:MAG: hypothetical protein JSV36_22040 [Anaerolineae bacterium]|nr:MAG: hypothetical protein JSV36_22040 [Anaerolineae bacterium]